MNLFMINSNLTTIKSKKTCAEILEKISENNILTFKNVDNGQRITITKDDKRPDSYIFYYHNGPIEWKTPGFVEDLESAIKTLYNFRKHYNMMWKD